MDYINKIKNHLEESNGIITAAYCRENHIPTVYLSRLVDRGVLNKTAPGIYLTENGDYDEFYFFQHRYKQAIFSYETALFLLGVTDKIIEKMDVTVSNHYKFNAVLPNVNVHFVKKEWLGLGVTETKTMFGNSVRVYNYERTLCDFILHREAMDPEAYINLIKSYPKYESRNVHQLYEIARIMNIAGKVQEIMEVVYEF